MSKKIGYVTLNSFNYGSSLQCFATSYFLKKNNFEPYFLSFKSSKFDKLLKLLLITKTVFLHPFSFREILRQVKSSTRKGVLISKQSLDDIVSFNERCLNVETYNKKNENTFSLFLTGSDQVFNGYRLFDYQKYFLTFVKGTKKASWSASFGGNEISSFNKMKYKKALKSFDFLSVRENSGKTIIENMGIGKDVSVLCDPIFLLNSSDWESIIPSKTIDCGDCVFLFFLNNPKPEVLDALKHIKENSTKMICLGYRFDSLIDIGATFYDGGPETFVSFIKNSKCIITDSFHATAFSILFKKDFYVFSRNYTHGQNQSTRVLEILSSYSISNRFDNYEFNAKPIDYNKADSITNSKKEDYLDYLRKITNEE